MSWDEFKVKWIAALRSGLFRQCQGEIKNNKGAYCPLGVAAVIAGASIEPGFGFLTQMSVSSGLELIPARLTGDDVTIGTGAYGSSRVVRNSPVYEISQLNDSGVTFSQIADWIESRL